MKKGAHILLLLGFAVARPLWAQGIISDSEIFDKKEENQSEVIPHRDLVYNPVAHAEATTDAVSPVLDEVTYFEDNIIESGQIAVDRVYDLIPYPPVIPFNVLQPDKGYLRADNKWDVEARGSADWEYNNNVGGSATARVPSNIVSVGGGILAHYGPLRPDPAAGGFGTPYTVAVDYDVSYDEYVEHPSFNSFNQELKFMGRIGRDTLIVTPYVYLGDVTSRPILDPERLGLIRERFLQAGTDVNWRFNDLAYRGTFGNSIANQAGNGLIDFESFGTHQEIGYTANLRSRCYVYEEYQNLLPDHGSFAWQEETGLGYDYVDNDTILGRFRWKSRIGWQLVNWENNPLLSRGNSGVRLSSEIGGFFTPKWEWIFHVGRDHQIDTSIANNGYLEDYIGLTAYWRPSATFGAGVTYFAIKDWGDTNNLNPFLQRVAFESNYTLSFHTILFARATYEHSIAAEVADPDVVVLRESLGIEYRF